MTAEAGLQMLNNSTLLLLLSHTSFRLLSEALNHSPILS